MTIAEMVKQRSKFRACLRACFVASVTHADLQRNCDWFAYYKLWCP